MTSCVPGYEWGEAVIRRVIGQDRLKAREPSSVSGGLQGAFRSGERCGFAAVVVHLAPFVVRGAFPVSWPSRPTPRPFRLPAFR